MKVFAGQVIRIEVSMAKRCAICGNQMVSSSFGHDKQICDLCLRAASGADDPVIHDAIPHVPFGKEEKRREALRRETLEKGRFDLENFEGKTISQYKFPPFITSKVLKPKAGIGNEALLICPRRMGRLELAVYLLFNGPVILLIVLIGLGSIVFSVYAIFTLSDWMMLAIPLAIIWNLIFFIVFKMHSKEFENDWVKLNADSIEFDHGLFFNSERAKILSIDNVKASYVSKNSGAISFGKFGEISRWNHFVRIVSIIPMSNGERELIEFAIVEEYMAIYWQEFLNWYISRGYKNIY